MKYAIILPDGASDVPQPELDGRTPLQAAKILNMDRLARDGRLGRMLTIPPGFTPATDVGTLGILGYDPHRYYSGRAPLEAAAQRLTASPDQIIFRCNLVTIEDGRMRDFTAGHVAQEDATALIGTLNEELGDEGCEFHSGVSYRNLMMLSDARDLELTCVPPHDIPDQPVSEHWPRGAGEERVRRIMERAASVLADHPVNRRLREAEKSAATNIWLWGQGRPVELEPFESRFGVRAAAITGVDIIRGITLSMGMELIHVPGATGYIDTDYAGKSKAALDAIDNFDLVVVHVEAPDEAGHLGSAEEKVKALERIDEVILKPLLDKLESIGEWRVLVAPDHATPVSTKAHSAEPPPFSLTGHGITERSGRAFTESDALETGLLVDPATAVIEQMLRR